MARGGSSRAGVRFAKNPVSVVRIGGIPVEASIFPAGRTIDALGRLTAAQVAYNLRKQRVCDAVAALIPVIHGSDKALARKLLGIKRDLFNGRSPRASILDSTKGAIPEYVYDAVSTLAQEATGLQDAARRIPGLHATEMAEGIDRSVEAVTTPEMLRAIEATNPSVYHRLVTLTTHPRSLSTKSRAHTVISAARYALRAGQKTSPLSSFGIVALGSSGAPCDQSLDIAPETFRRAEPSHRVLDFVTEAVIAEIASIADDAPVCINSSARVADGTHEWQRILPVPAGRLVRQTDTITVRSSSKFLTAIARIVILEDGTTTLGTLRNHLCRLLPQRDAEIDHALAEAWRTGFLVLGIPYDRHPASVARARVAALVPRLRNTLSPTLECFVATARNCSSSQIEVGEALRDFMSAGASEADADQIKPVIFEDCIVPGDTGAAAPRLSEDIKGALRTLLRLSPVLTADSMGTRLRRLVVAEFKTVYGEGGECRDIGEFIRRCSARANSLNTTTPSEREQMLQETRDSGSIHSVLHRQREELFNDLAERARGGDAVLMRDGELDARVDAMPAKAALGTTSHMFFVQATPGEDGADYVLNNIYPGASSTFSRFIPDDHPAVERIATYLKDISGDARPVEMIGTFGFNAAVHPRFTDEAVSIPPLRSPADDAMDINRFVLRHELDSDELIFTDENGQKLAIYFSAILNPLAMPLSHQIVRVLGSRVDLIEEVGRTVIDRIEPDAEGVCRLPRITYQRLVIARARLVVPRAALPDPQLSADAFFVAFNEWADRNDLSRLLFAGQHLDWTGAVDRTTKNKVDNGTRRTAKPIPLDRWSPLAVVLLQREIATTDGRIGFVEALPNTDQTVLTRGGKRVVSEYAVELTMICDDR